MPTSTVIDYERTYLCGRGVLRFSGEKVYAGQALTRAQLESIARPEGFLATGRIYPAPAGWTPPQAPEAVETPQPELAAVPVPVPGGGEPVLTPPAAPQFVAPVAVESPVAPVEPVAALTPAEQESAAQAFAEGRVEASEADGEPGDEFQELDGDDVDDPFTT